MPTSYINGIELFDLPCPQTSTETVTHEEYIQPMGPDGHISQMQYGADTGLRTFSVTHNLQDTSAAPNAAYIRDLFQRTKETGTPFAFLSPEVNNYFLVDFAESDQSLNRKLTRYYDAQINLIQVRQKGVTVYDPARMPTLWGYFDAEKSFEGSGYIDNELLNDTSWPDLGPKGVNLSFIGLGSRWQTNEQNGLPIVQLSPGGSSTYLARSYTGPIYEALIVLRVREATFSNYGGVLSDSGSIVAIVGDSGTTKFFNNAATDFIYQKNGITYSQANQQAPMEKFGLVRARIEAGWGIVGNIQIGRDRNISGRYGKIDIAAIVLFDEPTPHSDILDCAEMLQTRWEI